LPGRPGERLPWDFDRFIAEILARVKAGESWQSIMNFVNSQQIVIVEGQRRRLNIHVDLIEPILKSDPSKIAGVIVRGRMCRKIVEANGRIISDDPLPVSACCGGGANAKRMMPPYYYSSSSSSSSSGPPPLVKRGV
jgi:hypothetical protein